MKLYFDNYQKVLVCGGRHFDNYDFLEVTLDSILSSLDLSYDDCEIIEGGCVGADLLGAKYAKMHNIKVKQFDANWKKFGRAAGPIRNSEMIEYLSTSKNPIVVAFVSKNSKGTLDTINKAAFKGFSVYRFDYDNEDSYLNLFEGISINNNSFEFDWNNDSDEDIIKLSKTNINGSKLNGINRYFGYRLNQQVNKDDKSKFLKYVKSENGINDANVDEMIDRSVEEFSINNDTVYDLIIQAPSSSKLVSKISSKLSTAFNNCKILNSFKLNSSSVTVNKDKVLNDIKDKDYAIKLINFIQKRFIDSQKDKDFSISLVSPKYRKWISSYIKLNNENININDLKRVLIVDDNITTGNSIFQIINLLKDEGFTGDVDIFTLISNR